MPRSLARTGTMAALLVLAGCLDFSRFEHLPDANGLVDLAPDLVTPDIGVQDFAGHDLAADVLVLESFDTDISGRWGTPLSPASAFTIDDSTHVEGSGSLKIDLKQITTLQAGVARWLGTLPSDNGSRHLRFYARYEGNIDHNLDIALLDTVNGSYGNAVTLSSNNEAMGAEVFNNQFQNNFVGSNVVVQSDDWHCYELGIDLIAGQDAQWQSSLSIDGAPIQAATFVSSLPSEVVNLAVGAGFSEATSNTAKTMWIDAVELRADAAPIGCPYMP